jgi:hypothetical protein
MGVLHGETAKFGLGTLAETIYQWQEGALWRRIFR